MTSDGCQASPVQFQGAELRGPWLPSSLAGPSWKKAWWVAVLTRGPEVAGSGEPGDLSYQVSLGSQQMVLA